MAKKRAREADGATAQDPDKMVDDGESSDDEVRFPVSFCSLIETQNYQSMGIAPCMRL